MKARYLLSATAVLLTACTASAQYLPATYQEPYCREFTKVIDVGGRPQPGYGRACYQPDGSWQIVSDDIPGNQPVEYLPEQNAVAYQPAPLYAPAYATPYPAYYGSPYQEPGFFHVSFNRWNRDHHRHWRGREWDRGRGRGRWGDHHH